MLRFVAGSFKKFSAPFEFQEFSRFQKETPFMKQQICPVALTQFWCSIRPIATGYLFSVIYFIIQQLISCSTGPEFPARVVYYL